MTNNQGYFYRSPMDKAVGRKGTWVAHPNLSKQKIFKTPTVWDHPVFKAIMALSSKERLEVLSQFCQRCGVNDPDCQCELTNDK